MKVVVSVAISSCWHSLFSPVICGMQISPLVDMSSLNYVFLVASQEQSLHMCVHCKINLDSLAQISAFRNKKQNVAITYTTQS